MRMWGGGSVVVVLVLSATVLVLSATVLALLAITRQTANVLFLLLSIFCYLNKDYKGTKFSFTNINK